MFCMVANSLSLSSVLDASNRGLPKVDTGGAGCKPASHSANIVEAVRCLRQCSVVQ